MKKICISFIIGLFIFQPVAVSAAFGSGPIIFVIDTSGSMKQGKLDAVKGAVKEIVNHLQPDRKIGIISFSQKVSNVLPPTTSHSEALKRIDSLFAGGDTSMYDALEQALQLKTLENPSEIILLSDGADTTSSTRLEQIIKDAGQVGIPIEAIGVQVTSEERLILENIATTSGGNYYGVQNISTLISAYSEILSDQLVQTPKNSADQKAVQDFKIGSIKLDRNVYFEVLVATISAILLLLLLINLRNRSQNRKLHQARVKTLQKYSYRQVRKARNRIRISITTYKFVPARIEAAIRRGMESIHSEARYETVVQLLIAAWLLTSILYSLALDSMFFGIVIATATLPLGFSAVLKSLKRKIKVRFAEELPELLNILASALRAGLSLPQGLEAYSAETKNEVAREIRRSMSEIRVGTPVDEALMGVADRMDSDDLRWAVTALSIQRVVGGSMATILTTAYETVRARAEIRREVKTLAAEGRLSVYVLMALPIGIFAFLFLTRREYIQVLWSDPAGILILIIIGINLFIGWKWMKNIVEIKI